MYYFVWFYSIFSHVIGKSKGTKGAVTLHSSKLSVGISVINNSFTSPFNEFSNLSNIILKYLNDSYYLLISISKVIAPLIELVIHNLS